ncbi:MAG TPA: condensation domain-containing protein, partial [Pyrinomonadaceae bacterium]
MLRRCLEEVARRHETLRTRFATVDDEPHQVIEPSAAVELPLIDLSHLDAGERGVRVRELADEAARLGFDLARGPLWRASVVRLGGEEHVLLFTMHHIISDGWSLGVLVREMGLLYDAYSRGVAPALPELPIQYADYALWQRERLEGGDLQRQLDYWEERLAGVPEVLELPTDRPRTSAGKHRGGSAAFRLSAEVTAALKAAARGEGATLFMALLAGFEALLYRHTGQETFAVGTPVAGREREELKDIIGFFVNTLALPADLSGDPTFGELLGRVRAETLGAFAHQEAPFERVVERLRPSRVLDRSPIFQVMLALDNTPHEEARLGGLRVGRESVSSGAAKYDLSLLLEEREGGVSGVWLYDADLFDEASVRALAGRYEVLLAGAAADPSRRVSELPLLTGQERRRLAEWNETAAPFPSGSCVHELFERQARLTPDAVALVFEGESLTYAELDERAGRLAARLRAHGVGPESRVAILMERCAEMVAALLGVLKAGGAYVPLDPSYPQERLSFMLKDSGAEVVLTRGAGCEVPGGAARVVDVAEVWGAGEGDDDGAEGFVV